MREGRDPPAARVTSPRGLGGGGGGAGLKGKTDRAVKGTEDAGEMRVARVLGPAEYQRLRGGVQSGWKLSPEAQERVARPDASFLTPPWLPDGGAGWGVGSS